MNRGEAELLSFAFGGHTHQCLCGEWWALKESCKDDENRDGFCNFLCPNKKCAWLVNRTSRLN